MWVELTPDEIEQCREVARKRRTQGKMYRLNSGNSRGLSEEVRLDNEFIGCAAELAACKWLNVPWTHAYYEERKDVAALPDACSFIQTKAKRLEWHKLLIPVPQGIKRECAYLSVCVEQLPRCRMVGWLWGHEITDSDLSEPRPGMRCWTIPPQDRRMKSPQLLEAEAARRGEVEGKPVSGPKFDNDHKCHCGAYGSFGITLPGSYKVRWSCKQHKDLSVSSHDISAGK